MDKSKWFNFPIPSNYPKDRIIGVYQSVYSTMDGYDLHTVITFEDHTSFRYIRKNFRRNLFKGFDRYFTVKLSFPAYYRIKHNLGLTE